MNLEDLKIDLTKKATLVSIVCDGFPSHSTEEDTKSSLIELRELLRTLGMEAQSEHYQKRKKIDPATILGEGKIQEIADIAWAEGSELLVFDFELTASQLRNIKNLTNMDVVDRCMIILEIFALHARTKEAKIQIEISRLEYMLPRLTSMWTHFSKQQGGIGVRGGEGEQQLELDRRIVRRRLELLNKELKIIAKSREEQKKKRQKKAVTAALVGYTNAGKSSLMNKLCKVDLLVENKLFATLDSTFRTLNPDTHPPMLLIDTVGFIQNLPNTLIEGFKTTLDSAKEADLLIIVCDLSDPSYKNHLEVTESVLNELEIGDKERIIVFTKKDKIRDPLMPKIAMRNFKASFLVDSFNDEDIKNLREYIINYFLELQESYDLFIPFEDGLAHSKILKNTNIIKSYNHELGIFYRIRVPKFIMDPLDLKNYVLSPDDPLLKERKDLY